MKYEEAVTEARRLVKRSEADQWRLAELTWEQVEAGKTRRQWAKDIGVYHGTVARWYKIWTTWGVSQRNTRPTYSEAWNQVIGRVDGKYAEAGVRNLPPERKAEVARGLLTDPEVAEALAEHIEEKIASDPAATVRVIQKADEKRPAPRKPVLPRNAMNAVVSLTSLEVAIIKLREATTEVIADVMDGQLDPELLDWMIKSIDVDLQRLQIARSNDKNMDQALADLLSGE